LGVPDFEDHFPKRVLTDQTAESSPFKSIQTSEKLESVNPKSEFRSQTEESSVSMIYQDEHLERRTVSLNPSKNAIHGTIVSFT
jgi:hypothetical protein